MTTNTDLLQLHPSDNVGVCLQSKSTGEIIMAGGKEIILPLPVGIGHKLAIMPISQGQSIIKYGVVIGTATTNIGTGEHVHTHNMQSNYIPTYLIPGGKTIQTHA